MMEKRGQLTTFVIIAIVIVVGIIIYSVTELSFTESYSERFSSGYGLNDKTKIIHSNIFDCIESVTKQSLVTVGVQGGHYNRPGKFHELGEGFFSYYYYEGEYLMPSKNEIENSISQYVEENLEFCMISKEYPLNTEYSRIIVKTAIKEKEVTFNIDSQITFTEENTLRIVELKESEFSQESYLKGMIEIAAYLTEHHKTDPRYFCFNCLSQMAYERGVNAEVYDFSEKNTKHVIIYEETTNDPNLYIFSYLNKYTGEEKSPLFDE